MDEIIVDSVKIPEIFLLFIKTSLGHLILAFNPNFLIVLATATPVNKVINGNLEGFIFGLRIIESQIPPFGDSHCLADLPLAFVCVSAIITVPSSILCSAKNLAIVFVDVILGKQ